MDHVSRWSLDSLERSRAIMATQQNPLGHIPQDEIIADADDFVNKKNLTDKRHLFRQGALLARVYNSSRGFEFIGTLSETDKRLLRYERDHRWGTQPKILYCLCAVSAGCAVVLGMDQTIVTTAMVGLSLVVFELQLTESDQGNLRFRPPDRPSDDTSLHQWSPMCLRRLDWRLAQCPSEQVLGSAWHYRPLLPCYFCCRRLASDIPWLEISPERPNCSRPGRCRHLEYWACLCRRMRSKGHSWRRHHDVADVDSLWHHLWTFGMYNL